MLCFLRDLLPEASAIILGERVAKYLHPGFAVEPGHTLHEVRGGMVAEVRGKIAHAKTTSTGKHALGVGIRCLVQGTDLIEREPQPHTEKADC